MDFAESRRLDLNAEELGVSVASLMSRAGQALAREALKLKPRLTVVYCGKGNNGGDGLAAAAILAGQGAQVQVVLAHAASDVREPGRSFLQHVPKDRICTWPDVPKDEGADGSVVIDALLGSGAIGAPRAPYDAILKHLRGLKAPIIACDVPSGHGSKLAIRPQVTVAMHRKHEGLTRANAGRIVVAKIGIPAQAETHVGLGDLHVHYPHAKPDSHKGENGRVLVVGGSLPFSGAPVYAAMAAYRAGADLVHVAAPSPTATAIRAMQPEPIVHEAGAGPALAKDSLGAVQALISRVDAVVVGCGGGDAAETRALFQQLLLKTGRKGVVLDADGLDAWSSKHRGKPWVLTPHAGEFKDLTGNAATVANAKAFAKQNRVVVLLKGATDIITDGKRVRFCARGHSTMTVGGTGDVLAGCVAALLAKGLAPFEAACVGAYLVGSAGEIAASIRSYGATATDVHEAIPLVLARLGPARKT